VSETGLWRGGGEVMGRENLLFLETEWEVLGEG
jgi:hypothetical protein